MTFYPRKNRVLENLKKGENSIGMELYIDNPSLVEIFAYAGFDYYMLDMEHAGFTIPMW